MDPPPALPARMTARLAFWLLRLENKLDRPSSVLVVRTDDRVGNALLTIPLVRALQKLLPEARVDLLLAAKRAVVAEGLPNLRVLRFDKKRPWRGLWSLRRSYDVVIDAAHAHAFSLTSALLSRWASRSAVIGHDRCDMGWFYSRAIAPRDLPEDELKLLLASPFGAVQRQPLETSLGHSAPLFSADYVAINPGSRKEDHRWPAASYGALAAALSGSIRTIVLWGPGEEALAREVGAEIAPPTNLEQLASAFRRARLVITNDTGPMHLATACGAPVLAILMNEAGLRWTHDGPRFRSLISPSVEEAVAAAKALLDSADGAAEPAASSEAP
jgi:heptosyltransferase-3